MNLQIIRGYLGKDPSMQYLSNGSPLTKFPVAVNRRYKDKSGEWNEETTWFNVECWGWLAENTNQYLKKGSHVLIEGRMACDVYEKDGSNVYYWKLVPHNVEFLDKKGLDEDDIPL